MEMTGKRDGMRWKGNEGDMESRDVEFFLYQSNGMGMIGRDRGGM